MRPCLFFLLFAVLTSSCSRSALFHSSDLNGLGRDFDVVLEAVPIRARVFETSAVVDAIESEPEKMGLAKAVVLFRVEKVLRGDFTKVEKGGPSKFQQIRDVVSSRDVFKLLSLSDPRQTVEKGWISIAVENPESSFGIVSWEKPERRKYKLYLKRVPEHPDSYIFVKGEMR